ALGFGRWALGFGLWALGFWALGFGLWALGLGLWALGLGSLRARPLPREPQRLQRRAAGAGRVAVRHHVNRDARLFLALDRHAGADLADEPLLEFRARFERAATDDERVGIEGV